ncbi:hypothetical protein L9F63_026117 [Diploptera punctata]|uniref:Uncharacterized protein n=1 Tax=Diploptera punctata TaxID=6984 RepID=A0AAD7Z5N1_DIPPU|nr:hypothetical protein L9F63_026117 [Diploptera punctata]
MVHVEQVIKQHRPRREDAVLKNTTFKYHVLLDDVKEEMSGDAYFRLYDITDKRVRVLRKLLLQGKSPQDKREKNISGNKIKTGEVLKIHEPMSSFPVSGGHYRDVSI